MVVCGCSRIAVGIAVSVALWRIEVFGISIHIGIAVHSVHRRVHECLVVNSRIGVVGVVSRNNGIESHLQPGSHLLVQTGAHVETVVVVFAVVHDTVLVEVAETYRVVGGVRAACKVDRMAVCECGMNQLAVPVRAHAVVIRNVLGRGGINEVVHFHILLRACELHDVGGNLHAHIAVVSYANLAAGALLGCDDDNAVGGAYAVNRGSRCVLEHREALDIVRGQEVDIVHEGAVNHIERIGIIAYWRALMGLAATCLESSSPLTFTIGAVRSLDFWVP